jgi:hypothetical protein
VRWLIHAKSKPTLVPAQELQMPDILKVGKSGFGLPQSGL